MKKFYGSLDNRFDEGKQFVKEIKVGTGVTEYMYSDRHAYEVSQVISQEHIFIRKMDVKRIDKNGMSDSQDYKYISNPNNHELELVKRNNCWYQVRTFTKQQWLERAQNDMSFKTAEVAYNYYRAMSGLTSKQLEKIEAGKEVKKYIKFDNISIGVMEEYFDYTF